jgi:hypothetical protein
MRSLLISGCSRRTHNPLDDGVHDNLVLGFLPGQTNNLAIFRHREGHGLTADDVLTPDLESELHFTSPRGPGRIKDNSTYLGLSGPPPHLLALKGRQVGFQNITVNQS